MFHLVAVISKLSGKYLFYKDYWDKYTNSTPFFKFFATYIPFIVREKENTYKIVRWHKLRLAFGNFNEIVLILGGSLDTSDKIIEDYLIRAYEMLTNIFGDLTDVQKIPQNISEFSRELELIIRVSATKEDLEKMDWTLEERDKITQASEELNRRTTINSEQATQLMGQFAVEILDGTITKYRLFLTAAVRLKDAIHYNVIVDFSSYPYPPIFNFPQKLHNILGNAGESLKTIANWDPIHPPNWVEVVQELEEKVYKSETHLVEPIMEAPNIPQKEKGFAKQLDMPPQKGAKGIPYPQDKPPKPREGKGTLYTFPEQTIIPKKITAKSKELPSQKVYTPPKEEEISKNEKKKEVI